MAAAAFTIQLSFFLIALTASAALRTPWTSNRVVGSPNPPAPYTVERLFPKLTFEHPVDVASMPGSDRLFVLEQAGKLYSFTNRPDVERADLVFDFRQHHEPFDSAYAIAFHPRFLENGYLFVCYAEPAGRTNGSHISRFTLRASTTPPTIDPNSEKVVIRWLSGGHNGCTLAFGNDGFLYISTGDSASPDPPDWPHKTGQDISDLLACIVRIDVDRTEGTNAYAIPSDNPFVKTPGTRPEVYAFGLRNPWRMSFDRRTGDLWVGDVGWEQWEMIYRVKSGGNYGWSLVEGPNTHVRTDVKPGPGLVLPPIVALPHSEAASITGGRVYHGSKLAKLRGAYLYGDWETGKFWALRHDGDKLLSNDELCDTTLKVVSFAEDHNGELLILDYNGGIYTFETNSAPPVNLAFPRRLSETGLFQDLLTQAPAPGVVTYSINAEMWNDYASAEHLLAVPGDGAIVTADGRETIAGRMWYFPSNTVFAKTLTLEMQRGQPSTRRRIETQLLHFDGQAWNAYTFRWNTAQTDADLVPGQGTNDLFTVTDAAAPGGRREIPWRFASRAECFRCHNAWAGETLSFNWLQLNTPGPASEVQRLEAAGVLLVKNPLAPLPRLANPYAASLALADGARSWLHVNCSGCHRNGAGGDVPSQFNYDLPIEQSRALDAKPVRGDFGIVGARVIASGDPYRSTLFYRVSTEGLGRMPHIGSRLVDEAGVRLLRDWIRLLPAKPTNESDALAAKRLTEENAALLSRCEGGTRREAVAKLLETTSGCLALLNHVTSAAADVLTPSPGRTDSAPTNPPPTPPKRGTETREPVPLLGGVRGGFIDRLTNSASRTQDGQSFLTSAATRTEQTLRADVAIAAAAHTNALIRDLFQRLLPPDQRRRTLGTDFNSQALLAFQGNAARGRELYLGASQCSRCHVCDGVGLAFGPDLTGIGRKYTRAQLLDQILYPSKIIAPEYKTAIITLRDDTELGGFILKRTDTEVVLRDATLAEHRLKLSDVKATYESTLSAMPEGLLAPLTAPEAADLLEYLSASKSAVR